MHDMLKDVKSTLTLKRYLKLEPDSKIWNCKIVILTQEQAIPNQGLLSTYIVFLQ